MSELVPDTSGQVLLKLGEIGTQIAVITEKLNAVPDHESRIRALEKWKYSLPIALLFALGSTAASIFSLFNK